MTGPTLLDERVSWLRKRVHALPSDARADAARTWPRNLPRAAVNITSHIEIDEIARHLGRIEDSHGRPFSHPDPVRWPPRSRTQRPLWWFHRHLKEDDFTVAMQAIVDSEIAKAGDQAAVEADNSGLAGKKRAIHIIQAQRCAEDHYQPQAAAAIEHYVAARRADRERQRDEHIQLHGCHKGCRLLRGRL